MLRYCNISRRTFFGTGSRRLLSTPFSPFPSPPVDYADKFYIEPYTFKLDLEEYHSHERDKYLQFDSGSHTYAYSGNPISKSVTQLVDSYFKSFDADAVATAMTTGKNWPREGYINKDGKPFTKEQIISKWDYIKKFAQNKGSWLHHNIERYFNGLAVSPTVNADIQKLKELEDRYLKKNKIVPYRTEWKVVGEKEDIAGTIDFVGRRDDGKFVIIDWKTTAKLGDKFHNSYNEKAKYPIDHLEDCDGVKYSLQLNIYRYILQKYYDIEVAEMVLVSFYTTDFHYFFHVVNDMSNEVESLFRQDPEKESSVVDGSDPISDSIEYVPKDKTDDDSIRWS